MNGALILKNRADIMPAIQTAIEAFADDIRHKLGGQDFHLSYQIDSKHPDILVIGWEWDYLGRSMQKTFRIQVTDTAEGFVNRIKAYLFDLTVMIINM